METFSGKKFQLLGIIFLFLAVAAFAANWIISRRPIVAPPDEVVGPGSIAIPDVVGQPAGDDDILNRVKLKEVHETYQKSYLEMINRISKTDTTKIDVKKFRYFFSEYERNQKNYRQTLQKIEDYQKDFKIKCFAKMRSLILAVLFHDRKMQKRMTRFNPELLIEIGAMTEVPKCPSGGKYSIIYKDGRRFFHCSIHGTLRN